MIYLLGILLSVVMFAIGSAHGSQVEMKKIRIQLEKHYSNRFVFRGLLKPDVDFVPLSLNRPLLRLIKNPVKIVAKEVIRDENYTKSNYTNRKT